MANGPPPSLWQRIRGLLEPETGRGTAGLIGASVVEPMGTAIDAADFAAGFQDRDLSRMGWAAGGLLVPLVAGSTLRKVGPKLKKSLKAIKERNYLEDLSEVTPNLYRQESPGEAMRHLPFAQSSADDVSRELYMANTPDLALGQGVNKGGITIEFDPKGLRGQVNTSMPNWDHLYEGGSAEFIARLNPQSSYQKSARSFTIPNDIKMDYVEKRVFQRQLKKLEEAGWISEEIENGIRYVRPDKTLKK